MQEVVYPKIYDLRHQKKAESDSRRIKKKIMLAKVSTGLLLVCFLSLRPQTVEEKNYVTNQDPTLPTKPISDFSGHQRVKEKNIVEDNRKKKEKVLRCLHA